MSLLFADSPPGYDPIGAGHIAHSVSFLETIHRACFKFISWLSCGLQSRSPSGSEQDSGRIRFRAGRIAAGLFMSLSKQSHASSLVKVAPDPKGSLSVVTQRLADCICNVVPHHVAIFVPGKTPHSYNTVNFPAEPLAQIRNRFRQIQ